MSPPSQSAPLRLGIVGTGAIAGQMAQAARSVPDLQLSKVLSRDAARGARFCRIFAKQASACVEPGAFFDNLDAVYIATPAVTHGRFIELAIEAGTPILCEKPLTVSSAETGRLLSLARDAQVLLMESIWTLALPAYRDLKASFGARENAVLQFDFSYPVAASAGSHTLDPETGGVLMDRAVYGYAAAISLLGSVSHQTVWVTRNAAGLDTSAELRLEHADGARSLISLSFDRIGPNLLSASNAAHVITLGPGSLLSETLRRVPCPAPATGAYRLSKPGVMSRLKSVQRLRRIKAALPQKARFLSFGASPYAPILQEFRDTIRQGRLESQTVPHALSREIASLTEAARQSRET